MKADQEKTSPSRSAGEIDAGIDLLAFRENEEKEWTLPPWNNPLGQGVFPLFRQTSGRLYPIGTAFALSRYGLVATARHCLNPLAAEEPDPDVLDHPGDHRLERSSLIVLHYKAAPSGVARLTRWPIVQAASPHPSDALLGALSSETPPIPLISFKISPRIPQTETRVLTVGYRFPDSLCRDGIPLPPIDDGSFDWQNEYSHELVVVEGRVEELFLHRHRFNHGPCFLTGSRTHQGQSGGPVFNEAGHVCGIHSGCTIEGSGLASMIYPAVATRLPVTLQFGPSLRFQFRQSLLELMAKGVIRTDGSENMVRLVTDERGTRIDPVFRATDRLDVFDDAHSREDGRPSPRLPLPPEGQP